MGLYFWGFYRITFYNVSECASGNTEGSTQFPSHLISVLEHLWLSGLFRVTAHEPSENSVFYWTDRLHFLSPAERCPQLPTFKRKQNKPKQNQNPKAKKKPTSNNLPSVCVLLSHAHFFNDADLSDSYLPSLIVGCGLGGPWAQLGSDIIFYGLPFSPTLWYETSKALLLYIWPRQGCFSFPLHFFLPNRSWKHVPAE